MPYLRDATLIFFLFLLVLFEVDTSADNLLDTPRSTHITVNCTTLVYQMMRDFIVALSAVGAIGGCSAILPAFVYRVAVSISAYRRRLCAHGPVTDVPETIGRSSTFSEDIRRRPFYAIEPAS